MACTLLSGCQKNTGNSTDEQTNGINIEGFETTASGLRYRVMIEGEGEKPTSHSDVSTHYVGKHMNGMEFDNSYTRGSPLEANLKHVINGWQECLQMMKVGSIYEIVVPPELAYGQNGYKSSIEPNETLYFRIELLEVMK